MNASAEQRVLYADDAPFLDDASQDRGTQPVPDRYQATTKNGRVTIHDEECAGAWITSDMAFDRLGGDL